jgi:hypothetical protein
MHCSGYENTIVNRRKSEGELTSISGCRQQITHGIRVMKNSARVLGRNSGAQVLLVSKNGSNDFHGSALFRATRPGLNAYQRWNGPDNTPVQRDTDRFNQWAGSVGGPVIRNHVFFFFSYETLRNSTASLTTNWYETPQFLAAAKGVPNSIVSTNSISRVSTTEAAALATLLQAISSATTAQPATRFWAGPGWSFRARDQFAGEV